MIFSKGQPRFLMRDYKDLGHFVKDNIIFSSYCVFFQKFLKKNLNYNSEFWEHSLFKEN